MILISMGRGRGSQRCEWGCRIFSFSFLGVVCIPTYEDRCELARSWSIRARARARGRRVYKLVWTRSRAERLSGGHGVDVDSLSAGLLCDNDKTQSRDQLASGIVYKSKCEFLGCNITSRVPFTGTESNTRVRSTLSSKWQETKGRCDASMHDVIIHLHREQNASPHYALTASSSSTTFSSLEFTRCF